MLRPKQSTMVLTSELDAEIPEKKSKKQKRKTTTTTTKRGRAEEEIARIRGSSHDLSPSHLRLKSLGSDELMLSSPLRAVDYSKLMPSTPAMVFKKPARPPPSISPNTHLRNHRQSVQALVNSPSRSGGGGLAEELAWSPYFKLTGSDLCSDFGTTPSTPAMGSPLKGSAKRPVLQRTMSTPNHPLQDISTIPTNMRGTAKTPSQMPFSKPSIRFTPASRGKIIDALLLPEPDDFFDFGTYDDDDLDGLECDVDILQGFQKIGGIFPPPKQNLSPTGRHSTARPSTGRSSTSQL